MADPIQPAKQALRQQIRQQLAVMSETTKTEASRAARSRLAQQPIWKQAAYILFFAPTGNELDVWPLLESALSDGKSVALPQFVAATKSYTACEIKDPSTDLKLGQFEIREPADTCLPLAIYRLDLILVPGVAFDLHGRRLGRGKGFYDQLLAVAGGKSCGVAFDEQIVTNIPVEPHDIYVNCILTPTRWKVCDATSARL